MTRKGVLAAIMAGVGAAIVALLTLISPEVPLPAGLNLTLPEDSRAGSLKVPIVRYERRAANGSRQQVDFVGAIHLGEAKYYESLNSRFKGYDAVLFELVADPSGLKRRNDSHDQSTIGFIQKALADLLGLKFQLHGINYDAKNFVHADLSPRQLSAAMAARGESVASVLLKLLLLSFDPQVQEEMKKAGFKEPELEEINPVLMLLRGPTAAERLKLRLFFAQGLVSSAVVIKSIQGESGTALIDDRNAAVIRVTKEQLDAGRNKLAIFYGVGHMEDLDQRLKHELGLSIVEVEWVEAWHL